MMYWQMLNVLFEDQKLTGTGNRPGTLPNSYGTGMNMVRGMNMVSEQGPLVNRGVFFRLPSLFLDAIDLEVEA